MATMPPTRSRRPRAQPAPANPSAQDAPDAVTAPADAPDSPAKKPAKPAAKTTAETKTKAVTKTAAKKAPAKKVVAKKAAPKATAPVIAAAVAAEPEAPPVALAAVKTATKTATKAPAKTATKKAAAKKSSAKKTAPKRAAAVATPRDEASPVAVEAPESIAEAQAAIFEPAATAAPPSEPVEPAAVQAVVQAVLDTLASAQPAEPPLPDTPSHWQLDTSGPAWRLRWQAGRGCPAAVRAALAPLLDAQGWLRDDLDGEGTDDARVGIDQQLPLSLRLAAEAGHPVEVDAAIWPHLAAQRDARTRCAWLQAAYPEGAASLGLQQLLSVALPPFQAEGALWAVVAGRALLADSPGLGKGVQAIAAARLWQTHFGLRRVLVLCAPGQVAAWRHAWRRLAGVEASSGDVPPAAEAGPQVHIAAPGHLPALVDQGGWAPELLLLDEPQRLALDEAQWQRLDAPHALLLSGAALDTVPDALGRWIDWLDPQRLGPLAAWQALRAARDGRSALDDAAVERITAQLSRVLMQRAADEVADQLPPVIHGLRLVPPTEPQRQAQRQALARARRLLARWQASGYLADADQWALSAELRALQQAARRAEPGDPASPLAEALVQALAEQLDDWAEADAGAERALPPVQLLCERAEDLPQLQAALARHLQPAGPQAGLRLLAPGERPQGPVRRVLQVGAPWRLRRQALGARSGSGSGAGDAGVAPGQLWTTVCTDEGIDLGLLDTLAARTDTPRGPAEPGGRGFLSGERLSDWLRAVAAALAATPLQ